MFFKNLYFFRFSPKLAKSFAQIEQRLRDSPLKPVGPLELNSYGFVSPFGRDENVLSHQLGSAIWLTLGSEERLLPAVVVNDALSKKISEVEQKEARTLGSKARMRIKEDIIHQLLPKAFVRPARLNASLDLKHGFLAVDCSSSKNAERFASELRQALGSFPAVPLNAQSSVRAVLTAWISGAALPTGLSLGEECELQDPAEQGAIIKCQRQELESAEIKKHLEAGKLVTRLALVFSDHISFVLGDDLIVRKLKFLDAAIADLEQQTTDSIRVELDARYALFSAEIARLFVMLESAFKISKVE